METPPGLEPEEEDEEEDDDEDSLTVETASE